MKAVIFYQLAKDKDGTISQSLSEDWKLPAKGNYPERKMCTILFYSFVHSALEKMNITEEELQGIVYESEKKQSLGFMDCFTDIGAGQIKIVDLLFEPKRTGRVSIDLLTKIVLLQTIDIKIQ